jgi:hypothetical protein
LVINRERSTLHRLVDLGFVIPSARDGLEERDAAQRRGEGSSTMRAIHHGHETQHVDGVDVSQGVYYATARQIRAVKRSPFGG